MDTPIHSVGFTPLGPCEGFLFANVKAENEPSEKEALAIHLDTDSSLSHGPVCLGKITVRQITLTSQVLLCQGCGLRLNIPMTIMNIGELQEHIGGYKHKP